MTELFTILKAIERLATEILISKNQTNSRLLPPFAGSAEDKQAVPNRKRNCSIDKREFLFGLLKWSTLVLLLFAISAVTMDGTQVFSRSVTVPPVACRYFTGSTGGLFEQTFIGNLAVNVLAPPN